MLLDVAGVGYELSVPLSAIVKLKTDLETSFFVHTHVREDALILYGFEYDDDRSAFRTLLSVSGIGPRVALNVVSHMNAAELAEAVAREDRRAFKSISGVGKKTVERLLIDLKDKLNFSKHSPGTTRKATDKPQDNLDLALDALIKMGFRPSQAQEALSSVAGDRAMADILKDALANLN